MKVISYLECGCAIMENGGRSFCPTCGAGPTGPGPDDYKTRDVILTDPEGDIIRAWDITYNGKTRINVSATHVEAGVVAVVSLTPVQALELARWIQQKAGKI